MVCPIRSIGLNGHGYSSDVDCVEYLCAWWNGTHDCCAILALSIMIKEEE
jgi:hypothetical protein